jgi:hypothetical protein
MLHFLPRRWQSVHRPAGVRGWCVVRLEGDWAAVRAAVRERRVALGLSTAALARRARMSETTVRYLGSQPNRGWVLYELERVLGWPRGYLFGLLSGKPPDPGVATTEGRLVRIEAKVDEIVDLVRNGFG